jgi:hypothetical protein
MDRREIGSEEIRLIHLAPLTAFCEHSYELSGSATFFISFVTDGHSFRARNCDV